MDFKVPYNRSEYIDFFRSQLLPEDFRDHSEDIAVGFKSHLITKAVKIGEVPSLELLIYEVLHPSENDPRVSLSRDAFRLLAQYGAKRALIIFNSENSQNFRLSLVTIDLKWEEGKRVEKEYSNPRRYSFFLGPETKVHTPQEYLIKHGRVKDFDDLKKRFSIEVVNKEFYTQIAVLFTQLAGGKREIGRKSIDAGRGLLNLPSTVDDTLDKEFTVRLIGRLVFCWFLKKKRSDKNIPLLPEELLSAKAVLENKGYYHGILEPLFFEVLNTPADNRTKKYQCSPWSQIPFLNGGLFTPHLHDFYEPGPLGISKHINTLKVPDHWIKELFEVFETYNFTIDENTSVDVELSIEPEMLGRIFENLLAEINPETGETARKATGSYYTPRPIVEYMVDESLKQYLLTKTKLEEDKITRLLTYEDVEIKLTGSEKESVLNALDTIKIIDPACGSGAFPMGILQKMLLILQKVDPESEWWLDTKLSQIESKLLKKELGKKLKDENVNYVHKLGIIQSSIYGVDIQPIAVEISKLRFFLSLIVDETVNDTKENRGIEPLPNLEFKFICANSLIGLPKKDPQQTLFEVPDDIKALRDLRDEYLRSYGEEKKKIEKRFQEVQSRMFKHSIGWGGKDSQTLKLSQWNPFSEDPCSWFDPDWMFGVKEGFGIAIANPPWVSLMGKYALEENKKNVMVLKKIYKDNTYMPNLYEYFIQRSIEFLKEGGHIVFIVPDRLGFNESCAYLRKIILQSKTLKEIIYRWKFEGIVADTMTFIIANMRASLKHVVKIKHRPNEIAINLSQDELLQKENHIFKSYQNSAVKKLVDKIRETSDRLDAYCKTTSGFGGKSELITDKKINSAQTPVIKGQSINRYRINKKYYFDLKRKNITGRTRDLSKLTCKEKILLRKTGDKLIATFDDTGLVPEQSLYFTYEINPKVNPKYLLGLINSRLLNWYYINELVTNVDSTPQLKNYDLDILPVKSVNKDCQDKVVLWVEKILKIIKETNNSNDDKISPRINAYERQIDQMVYDLYGLTKKEIEIVEGMTK